MERRLWIKAGMGLAAIALGASMGIQLEPKQLQAQERFSEKPPKKNPKASKPRPSPEKKVEPQADVHWPKDISRLQGLETDHVPLLEVLSPESKEEAVQLIIRVGRQMHSMTQTHYLHWVQVWIEDLKACEMSLQPGDLIPRWQLSLQRKPSMQITVKAKCNLHGVWANRLVL
jgi:desulfoferrodoxin-like iron-binding protein